MCFPRQGGRRYADAADPDSLRMNCARTRILVETPTDYFSSVISASEIRGRLFNCTIFCHFILRLKAKYKPDAAGIVQLPNCRKRVPAG